MDSPCRNGGRCRSRRGEVGGFFLFIFEVNLVGSIFSKSISPFFVHCGRTLDSAPSKFAAGSGGKPLIIANYPPSIDYRGLKLANL